MTPAPCAVTIERLPEGATGIAAKHPGDAGIAKAAGVIFACDFENLETETLKPTWDHTWGPETNGTCQVTSAPEGVHSGKKGLELTIVPPTKERSNGGVMKYFKEGYDTLFLRYYAKFAAECDYYHGGAHNGGHFFARAPGVATASPGIPGNGLNKFDAALDTFRPKEEIRSPGDLVIYCYHADQQYGFGEQFYPTGRILYPGGQVAPGRPREAEGLFEKQFTPRPNLIPEQGRWYCYELMLQANGVGKRDGRIAYWVDGKLAGDFPNLRFRETETLKINGFNLINYTHNTKVVKPCTLWYDDIVVAMSYIGPRT